MMESLSANVDVEAHQVPHLQLVQSYTTGSEGDGHQVASTCVDIEISEGVEVGFHGSSQGCAPVTLHVDKKVPSEDSACCHCNSSFGELQTWVKLQDDFNCQLYHSNSKTVENCAVKIVDAIEDLFRFNRACKQVFNRFKVRENVVMCSKCVSLLSELYELYHGFMALSMNTSSALAEIFSASAFVNSPVKKLVSNQVSNDNDLSSTNSVSSSSLNCEVVKKNLKTSTEVDILRSSNQTNGSSIIQVKTRSKVSNLQRRYEYERGIENSSRSEQHPGFDKKHCTLIQQNSDSTRKDSKDDGNCDKSHSQEPQSAVTDKEKLEEILCDRCNKTFKNRKGLKTHYASHLRDDKKLPCKLCEKRFKNIEALELHDKIEHQGFKPHECPHEGCNKRFRLKEKLKIHIKDVHEQNKPFPCPKCTKSFRTHYHLKAHDATHKLFGDASIGCSKCKRKFSSKEDLDKHIMKLHTATGANEKRFMCSKCDKGFPTLTRLKSHEKSHRVEPTCICPVCGKAYKELRSLQIHETLHQDKSQHRFACGDCPERFYRIDLLRVHQSNENHFSPEVVGPSIGKLLGSKTQNRRKSRNKCNKTDSDAEDEDDLEMQDKTIHTDFQTVEITIPAHSNILNTSTINKVNPNSTTKSSFVHQSSTSTSSYPTTVELSLDNAGEETSSTTLEDENLSSVTSVSLSGLPQPQISSNMSLQNSAFMFGGNTLYSINDPSDKNSAILLSAQFSAEQVGYEVINAFMNDFS